MFVVRQGKPTAGLHGGVVMLLVVVKRGEGKVALKMKGVANRQMISTAISVAALAKITPALATFAGGFKEIAALVGSVGATLSVVND